MNTTLQTSSSLWNDDRLNAGEFYERRAADGSVRPHWQKISGRFESLGLGTLRDRSDSIEQLIRENGITFHATDKTDTRNRPWQLSVIPFVLGAQEWRGISDGLQARTRLLEHVLQDLLGEQRLIRERVVPGEVLWSNPAFHRAYHQLDGMSQKLHVTAADLARGSDGVWRVIGDRTRAPSGLGYLLENRIASSRALPTLIRLSNTLRLASFFEALQKHLQSLAPVERYNPRVALLTPPSGSYREFEDTYLARYLGLTLIQGSDLAVRDGRLNLKTLGGLQSIQVLWRHISDRRCDPLELDPNSIEGVTGLLGCVRRKSVAVVNSIGSVLAQTPALMPYLDAAHQFFFGGPLQLTSAPTYWCGDPKHLDYVHANLDALVFRDAMAVTSRPPIMPAQLSVEERDTFLARLNADPKAFVAQHSQAYSQTPVWSDGEIRTKKLALRSFHLNTGDQIQVLPGALARVGNDELELMHSPVSGNMTLDCWITSDQPVDQQKTLLSDSKAKIRLRRGGDELPSRVAEHLYWLGRYAERGEAIARVLRTTLNRIAGEENWDTLAEVRRLVYTLASMGQIEPSFAVESFVANLPHVEKVLPASVLDGDQPRGLIRTIESVVNNATAVRDRLSIDAYRIIQRASQELNRPVIGPAISTDAASGTAPISISEALERIGMLIADLLSLAGVFSESFVRTHAWQFLDLGRRIERADHTCDLLTTMLCPPTEDGKAVCMAVLEITDSSMTYRSRYMNLVRLGPVIDLLVTDETNPRSLRYQLDRIADLLDQLPSVDAPVGLSTIQRIVIDLQYKVTTADPIELSELGSDGTLEKLRDMLSSVALKLPQLSDGISARYLIHTESTQLLTGSER